MFKKIVLVLVVLCVCYCGVAFANDADALIDYSQDLIIKVKPESYEIAIGEEFAFKTTLTNTTKYAITFYKPISILESDNQYTHFFEYEETEVPPYETISIEYSYLVTPDINWYKYHGEYYVNTKFEFVYWSIWKAATYYSGEFETWEHINPPLESHTLKITNLHDGSDMLNIDVVSDDKINFYRGFTDPVYDKFWDLFNSKVVLESTHTSPIDIVSVNGDLFENAEYDNILPNTITKISSTPYIQSYQYKNEIPNNLKLTDKVIFKSNDKYYCVDTYQTLPVVTSSYNDLRVTISPKSNSESIDSEYVNAVISIKNISSRDLHNVVFCFNGEYESVDARFPSIALWDTKDIPIKLSRDSTQYEYFCGWQMGSEIQLWRIPVQMNDFYFCLDEYYTYASLQDNSGFQAVEQPSIVISTLSPVPSSSLPPVITPSIPPTAAPTVTATITTSVVPTQILQISNIENKGCFPNWVWIILILSIVGTTVCIILLRIKSKE